MGTYGNGTARDERSRGWKRTLQIGIEKRCPHCEQYKTRDEFKEMPEGPFHWDGLSWWCKECTQQAYKQRYEEQGDEIREKAREYAANHVEERGEWNKAWREENPDVVKELHRQWYEKNKEKIAEQNATPEIAKRNAETHAKYRENNREELNAYNRDYHAANKERIKEQKKKYQAENAEKIRERRKLEYQAKKATKQAEQK